MERRTQIATIVATALIGAATVLLLNDGAAHAALADRMEQMVAGLDRANAALSRLKERDRQLGDELDALRRFARTDHPSGERRALVDSVGEPDVTPPAAMSTQARVAADARREFEELLASVLAGDYSMAGSIDDQERFWELARTTSVLDDLLDDLESSVASNPQDLAARLDLADAYVAKLLTVPAGPERGVWGGKAESQWQEVLSQDDRNWDAQFKLANNYSYYPEFLGKSAAAIEGLERARMLQQSLPAAAVHVQTYLSLSRVYLQAGQADKARAALENGMQLHPGDDALMAALDHLDG